MPQSQQHEPRGVALLLAAAAAVAAALAGWSSLVAADAADRFDAALRAQLGNGAADVLAQKTVYVDEAPNAIEAAVERLHADALSRVAAARPDEADGLLASARTHRRRARALSEGREDLSSPRYRTPAGGVDVDARLRDVRGAPAAVAPDASRRSGEELMRRASRVGVAAALTALAFLCGALAQVFPRRRRPFLAVGAFTLVATVALALAVGGA